MKSKPSPNVVKFTKTKRAEGLLSWWCPECKAVHSIPVGLDYRRAQNSLSGWSWYWNGDLKKPIVYPCILNSCPGTGTTRTYLLGSLRITHTYDDRLGTWNEYDYLPVDEWPEQVEVVGNKALTIGRKNHVKEIIGRD